MPDLLRNKGSGPWETPGARRLLKITYRSRGNSAERRDVTSTSTTLGYPFEKISGMRWRMISAYSGVTLLKKGRLLR